MSDFNNLSNSHFSNNYYSSKVKEGIPIFQEENGGNLYNNYIDPFKLLETQKNNTIFNPGFNNNISNTQTRNIMEREMNPYLMQMKNELNLIIEKFRKEMNEKNNYLNEIGEIKEELIKIKQNTEDNYLNMEQKILNINDILNNQENKLNNLQSEIFQLNHMNKKNDDYFLKNEIENMKNKVINIDNTNDKYLKEMTQNLEKIIDYKFDNMNKNIIFIKEENNAIKNDIIQNNIKIEMINSENEKKNERINDINSEFNNISNQINKIMINNNKTMNMINTLEINNSEYQQKIRNLNEKINSLNENFQEVNIESKNQKENINLISKNISEIENNLNILENERTSLNNKIMELNIKLEYQEEKITKNNNIINNTQNENNNILYKDMSSQISKSKKIIDDMREKYDKEISELKNNINQFDNILKNNPFFNMNETERISILFKKEQVKFNETFREQLKLLNEEIKKMKNVSGFDKSNLEIINKNFKKHTNDINMLEQSLKSWTQIAQILTKNYEKIKKDKFSDDKSSNNNINFTGANFEDNLNKIQKYINKNKNDINNLQLDIKEINEKTVPEIYKYINEQFKLNENVLDDNNINKNENNNINNKNDINSNKMVINNFNDKVRSKNLEELVSKIELMGSVAQNVNKKFNEKNMGKDQGDNFSIGDKKDEDLELINEFIGGDNKNDDLDYDDFDK